jgi:hypothetical protein
MAYRKNNKRNDLFLVAKGISMILQLGISMMVPVALCLFVGIKLDKHFETSYITVIFLFLGFAAGIRSVYTITKGFYAESLKKENEEQEYFKRLHDPQAGEADEGSKTDLP